MGELTLYVSSLCSPLFKKETLVLILKFTVLILLVAYVILQAVTQLKQMDDDFK